VLTAFTMGLPGGVHCAAMCGGVMGAVSLRVGRPGICLQLCYDVGRILSYAVADTLAGVFGGIRVTGQGRCFVPYRLKFAYRQRSGELCAFFVRGLWVMRSYPDSQEKWVRALPHVVDGLLVLSAVAILAMSPLKGWPGDWLTVKLALIVIYVALGLYRVSRSASPDGQDAGMAACIARFPVHHYSSRAAQSARYSFRSLN